MLALVCVPMSHFDLRVLRSGPACAARASGTVTHPLVYDQVALRLVQIWSVGCQ